MLWLRGINRHIKGQCWELSRQSRVGRLDHLEVVVDDPSVSRTHAELDPTPSGWRLRDLGSTNGTFLNGAKMGPGQWPLRVRDLIQFGDVVVMVEGIDQPGCRQPPAAINSNLDAISGPASDSSFHLNAPLKMESGGEMKLEASSKSSWSEALVAPASIAGSKFGKPEDGDQNAKALIALLQSSRHLMFVEHEEDLLRSILEEAVKVLNAQRGAIVLAGEDGELQVRAVVEGKVFTTPGSRALLTGEFNFSKSLADKVFSGGQSILCSSVVEDPTLKKAPSIKDGDMASVICALLRTPRRALGVLHLDRSSLQSPFTKDQLELADALAAQVSAGIEAAHLIHRQREMFHETITVLGQVIELRDEYTGGHTKRVTRYALLLGEVANLHPDDLELLRTGAPLHDIGKIGIPDGILRKEGPLSPGEVAQMRRHAELGGEILASIPSLAKTASMARYHHEWWDGSGYPEGLKGEDIPLMARILAIADVFDALTSLRPYRQPLSLLEALAEMEKLSAKQFDPRLFGLFRDLSQSLVESA